MTKTKEILKKNTMLIALVVIMLLFQVLISAAGKGSLFAPANVTNLILQNSYVVILAVGMLLCILTGGNIDLSVGSVVALVGAIAGVMIVNHKMNVYLTIITCLLMGILIGAWQGFWIAYVRIPAFIVTLAGMMLWRGLALIVLDGLTISPFPDEYLRYFSSFLPGSGAEKSLIFGVTVAVGAVLCAVYVVQQLAERNKKARKNYELAPAGMLWGRLVLICAVAMALSFLLGKNKGIPVVLILLGVIVLVYSYYTQNTVPGRYLYAMGGNEKAAKLSGINTNRTLFFAYTNMGFLSAVAALVCIARFNSAAPSAGTNYELDAIGACYIGGASAYGGTGTIGGAVIGAIFMGVLNNGMSILGIDSNWQRAVKGLVLLAAVVFDVLSKKRSTKA
ncbi:multiple monosaccharide ABC transporter permease [Anaerotruncus sp. 1XD42-93]|uniref:multiple monosaccharide ABC transporter permease n=1 Tax=Anaerotruncus sp. 1XD42-93 TaxID=2320853 RepID=UPI000EA08697|nr:multiple monosaccharide ABC transporter permease [Anaerotruncus sp. 1XD42-93]NBK17517.1 sugar ABC transporter permease [Anaerotruncus sp. 1XD42-93]NCE73557.1 sugar ABC transporter permease [Anaerotruncus sp. X29]RKJ97519.1 sugar ABC transporter permease [Anaerotruncus sp. 1XD22-93]